MIEYNEHRSSASKSEEVKTIKIENNVVPKCDGFC